MLDTFPYRATVNFRSQMPPARGSKGLHSKKKKKKQTPAVLRQRLARHGFVREEASSTPYRLRKRGKGKPSSTRGHLESALLKRAGEVFEALVANASDSVISRALAEPSPVAALGRMLADPPSPPVGISEDDVALAAARARGALRKQQLLEDAGGAVTGSELADLLGISRQAVSDGRGRHLYFAVPVGDRLLYPKFQLTNTGILPGLREFLQAFPIDDPWGQLNLLLSPSPYLGKGSKKRTPLDALHDGDIGAAVAIASSYGEHGA